MDNVSKCSFSRSYCCISDCFFKKMIKCSIKDTKPVNTFQFERKQDFFFFVTSKGKKKKKALELFP